jgi:hypothetical protein
MNLARMMGTHLFCRVLSFRSWGCWFVQVVLFAPYLGVVGLPALVLVVLATPVMPLSVLVAASVSFRLCGPGFLVVLHVLVVLPLAPVVLQCPFAVRSRNSPSSFRCHAPSFHCHAPLFRCRAPSSYVGVSLFDWYLPLLLVVLPVFVVFVWWAVGFDRPCHPLYEQGLAAVMAGATGGGNRCGWGSSVGLPANIC